MKGKRTAAGRRRWRARREHPTVRKITRQAHRQPHHPATLRLHGSPLDCEVFIVGANPATPMPQDYWAFWRRGIGMDKAAWFEAYKLERAQRPLSPGKTRRMAVSNTRRNIDLVVEGAAPFRCLETNVFSAASATTASLKSDDRMTAIFDFLMQVIKPRLVVAHGREAANELRALGTASTVREVKHLARGWSGEEALRLGQSLRAELRSLT